MIFKIGIVLILLSIELYLSALKNQQVHNWVPATAPLILKKDSPTQLSFVAEGDFEYDVELSFKKTVDSDALNSTIDRIKANADIEVQVEESGKQVITYPYSDMANFDTGTIVPSTFHASGGRRYTVTITPRKSFPNLQTTAPQAKISIDFREFKHTATRRFIFTAYAAAFFLGGLGFTLLGWWRKR